jgi:glycosyltransferase involved in cell wall biosynthesis
VSKTFKLIREEAFELNPSTVECVLRSLVEKPDLSLIIPTYDRYDLLNETLRSVVQQNNHGLKLEIIVLADNPTFDFKKINIQLDQISLYKNTSNLGLFETMNLGVNLATGKYVAFLHDDDVLNPNYFSEIEKILKRKPDLGALMIAHKQIGQVPLRSRFRSSRIYRVLKPLKDRLSQGKVYQLRIFDNILWCADQYGPPSCGSLFERAKFLSLNGFNPETYPSGDWFFMVAFNQRYSVYKTTEQLAQYRWSENASTKRDVIAKFITQNLELREYFREHYVLGKVVYHLTKKVHYRHILEVFIGFDQSKTLKPDDFNHIMPYPSHHPLYFWYLNGQRAYWIFRVMISLVIG